MSQPGYILRLLLLQARTHKILLVPMSKPVHLTKHRNKVSDNIMIFLQQQDQTVVVASCSQIVKHVVCLHTQTHAFYYSFCSLYKNFSTVTATNKLPMMLSRLK